MDPIHSICVCGAGTMGSGIAQVAAQSGFYTILYDLDATILTKAKQSIGNNLQSLVDKGKLSSEKKTATLAHIKFSSDINQCVANLLIEAIIEKAEAKVALFNQLAELNHRESIFATNTSSLSVKAIAEKVLNPERIIGLHFFNPAPLMKLVEVVKTPYISQALIESIVTFAKQLGKTPVLCEDAPGFIVNHVARPYYLEALKLVELGYADFKIIDELLESSGFKLGPFRLMDLIGNDVNYAVSCSVYEAMNKPERLKPSSIQKEKVEKGELGRKTNKGYYTY